MPRHRQFARFSLRQQHQIAYQSGQAVDFAFDAVDGFIIYRIDSTHQLHIPFDHGQRRPQFMTNIRQESPLGME